ncbi:hypothetical protein F4V43_02190 [Paenibacillus spiritus]|uniref:Uncharacterized protein n=1 Tax=Paenibacillus spiritus TaxID=2496557 RepID=A0A5J5GGU6_9BACL|nr:hypothetical protein [Paenibacillus spiritus]KAA9007317.1 hypothetical protein F4V43_02190 [Paenibacillus spiritus]
MDDKLFTMIFTLHSGIKGTANLSSKQVDEFIQCFKEGRRYVTVVGEEYFGINTETVSNFRVSTGRVEIWDNFSSLHKQIESEKNESITNLIKAYDGPIRAKIDCKVCGRVYVTELEYCMEKTYCSGCRNDVFLQEKVGIIRTSKGMGYLYTNERKVKQ